MKIKMQSNNKLDYEFNEKQYKQELQIYKGN